MRFRAVLLVPFLLTLAAACASPTTEADETNGGSEDEIVSGSIRARASDPCTATLVFLQKDAYKETAGRSSALFRHTNQ